MVQTSSGCRGNGINAASSRVRTQGDGGGDALSQSSVQKEMSCVFVGSPNGGPCLSHQVGSGVECQAKLSFRVYCWVLSVQCIEGCETKH